MWQRLIHKVIRSQVVCVGCDEMSVRKGHHYISVFCDLIGKRVVFAVEGKDKRVWAAFAKALEEHHGRAQAITKLSMEMSVAYIAGAKESISSQASIGFDKYHVIAPASGSRPAGLVGRYAAR